MIKLLLTLCSGLGLMIGAWLLIASLGSKMANPKMVLEPDPQMVDQEIVESPADIAKVGE